MTPLIADHLRQAFFGRSWTASSLQQALDGVTWQQATYKVEAFHTIAELVYHIGYFVDAILAVTRGNPLEAHDKFSFDCPEIDSDDDWEQLVRRTYENAESLATEIERLPAGQLETMFVDEKYGTYYRNLQGLIEHTYYHLGQIVILTRHVKSTREKAED